MACVRCPMQANARSGRVGAKPLVTGRHPRATCPMQSRAKLIGGREKRPRNAVCPFEKVLVSGLCVCKVARKTELIVAGAGFEPATFGL
jgi:hypothetical protein